mgnify:CR=1 FL=1
MIDTDEKVDARTVEEDMETRNNMTWLNNRVVELEAEVKRLRKLDENARRLQEKTDWLRSALDGILHDLKEIIE